MPPAAEVYRVRSRLVPRADWLPRWKLLIQESQSGTGGLERAGWNGWAGVGEMSAASSLLDRQVVVQPGPSLGQGTDFKCHAWFGADGLGR